MPLQQRLFLLSCDSRLQLCSFSETSRFQKIYLQRPAVTFQDDMQYANVPILFKESSPTPTLKGIKIELPEISDCFPPIKSHLCTRRWVEGRRTKVVATEMTYFYPTILQKKQTSIRWSYFAGSWLQCFELFFDLQVEKTSGKA